MRVNSLLKKSWLFVAALLCLVAAQSARSVEEPAWALLDSLGDVEIRLYAPLVQARTSASTDAGESSVFRTLADYIFGGNSREQEIAMTAPVETSLAAGKNYMAFNMPAELTLETLPRPKDESVILHEVPERTMAVVSFSGWAREAAVEKNLQRLLATLSSRGIQPRGQALLAQYNPPWTLPWKRRNEVMIEIPAEFQ